MRGVMTRMGAPTSAERLRSRLATGAPFRLGELAQFLGFSREHLRKLAVAGVLRVMRRDRAGAHRRVTVAEAERFAQAEGLL